MESLRKFLAASPHSWTSFRDLGASPPWLYFAVFSCFAGGSFFRDSAFFWLPLLLGFMTAFLLRMNVSDLLILALPFHFLLEFSFSATLSLAHFVLPFALLELLLQRPNDLKKLAKNPDIGLLALWLVLLALSSGLAGLANEIDVQALFFTFSKLAISVLFAVWAISRLSHQPELFLLLKLWVWVAVGVAILGFISNFVVSVFDYQSSFFKSASRLMATFENPNHFALHMLVSALLSLAISMTSQSSSHLVFAVLLLYTAVASNSQAVHLALLFVATLGLIVVGFDRHVLIKQSVFTLSGYLFVAAEYIPLHQGASGRLTSRLEIEVINDVRWEIWAELIDIWSDFPWFGIGLGQFAENSLLGLSAHNTPLSLLVETGILFTLLTLAMFFAVVTRGLVQKGLSRMFATFVLGMAVFGLGNDVHNTASFWIVVGVMAALSVSPRRGVSITR